jgi:hypothetical protein
MTEEKPEVREEEKRIKVTSPGWSEEVRDTEKAQGKRLSRRDST